MAKNSYLKKIHLLLNQYSIGKTVILFFLITQILYSILLFYTIPELKNYSDDMEILDMKPTGYSAEYAKGLLEKLGIDGRNLYLYKQIPVDMVYPLMFSVSYSLLLTYLFKKTFQPQNKIYHFSVLPIFAGLFDYLENIGIAIMLYEYPRFSYNLANITNIFTIFKSLLTTVVFILLIVVIMKLILRKLLHS
jgi:hypothetical protein